MSLCLPREVCANLLKEIGKLACNPTDTPIEFNHKLGENKENAIVDRGNNYRLVGCLIYMFHRRPDIVYDTSIVS